MPKLKKGSLLLLFLFGFTINLFGQIAGTVYNDHNETLPNASILLLPDSIGTSSNINGYFSFPEVTASGNYILQIDYIGHKTYQLNVVFNSSKPFKALPIQLEQDNELLAELVVTDEHAKQERTLSSIHFDDDLLHSNLQGSFAKSIEQLPGINAINVGVGIAKPVIRGLSANRIIVNQQGIKQESHQWGSDHGLEVDQFDVERVEIIKGPASLQYGSDGLGGVINILPGKVINRNTFAASVEGVYKSNNQHWGGSVFVNANINDFFITARYSRQDFGDYRVPASQFNYNGFSLPIYNNTLKNTAGQEENIRITAGWKAKRSITRILYGHYALKAGLFSGAVGIPRSYALTPDGNKRDIDVPSQNVNHYRVSLHHAYFVGNNHFNLNIGYQRNVRQEFSFPEFHNIPSSQIATDNTLALQFNLQTFSANMHYEHLSPKGIKSIIGANVQYQNNQRSGFEFLLPDFTTLRSGIFTISEWSPSEHWIVNAGIRLDYAHNNTNFYRQFIWDSNENITDSLVAPTTTPQYLNWSASMGVNWQTHKHWWIRANLGKSFRVPYPAETVSNGIHHGTFRHEVGTPNLESEHGYQLDISADVQFSKLQANLSSYFNYFHNYIYLGPTFPAQFSNLPEAGQIFQYRQDNAIYNGFEWQVNWQFYKGFSLQQTADFVQSYNTATQLALPFTPQPTVRHQLQYQLVEKGIIENWKIHIEHQYAFAAEGIRRVDRTELSTPAYQLWHIGTTLDLHLGQQAISFNVQVQNLFNTSYLNHLSRYRLINIPEQGRNIVLSIRVPFVGKLKK